MEQIKMNKSIYIAATEAIRNVIDTKMEDDDCKNYQISSFRELDTFWMAVMMHKQSKWYKRVNFAVIERSVYIQSKPERRNISHECEEYLFPTTTPPTQINYAALSMDGLGGLFVIVCASLLLATISLFIEIFMGSSRCSSKAGWERSAVDYSDASPKIQDAHYRKQQCIQEIEKVIQKFQIDWAVIRSGRLESVLLNDSWWF